MAAGRFAYTVARHMHFGSNASHSQRERQLLEFLEIMNELVSMNVRSNTNSIKRCNKRNRAGRPTQDESTLGDHRCVRNEHGRFVESYPEPHRLSLPGVTYHRIWTRSKMTGMSHHRSWRNVNKSRCRITSTDKKVNSLTKMSKRNAPSATRKVAIAADLTSC